MAKEKEKINSPKIAGFLEETLIKTFQDPTLKLAEYNVGTGLYVIVNGNGFKQIFDKENSHNVGLLPYRILGTYTYWISFGLEYDILLKAVRHISITFFDDSIEKLFRAEWANNTGVVHAQPHWHFHNHKAVLGSDIWQQEYIDEFIENTKVVDANKLSSFHFAMASTWQTNSKCEFPLHKGVEKELVSWAKEVINYSINQFTYIHSKSHAAGTV